MVLKPDHSTMSTTDTDDVSSVRTAVTDSSVWVVTGSCAPVAFGINGPDVIIAVDGGSRTQESYRCVTARKTDQKLGYALVGATGRSPRERTASPRARPH